MLRVTSNDLCIIIDYVKLLDAKVKAAELAAHRGALPCDYYYRNGVRDSCIERECEWLEWCKLRGGENND